MRDQTLAQRFDDRDAARDGRFEFQRDTLLLCELGKIGAVARKQRLVRGDDMLAVVQCRPDEIECGSVFATDEFDDHIGIRLCEIERAVRPFQLGHVVHASFFTIERADLRQQYLASGPGCEIVGAFGKRTHHAAANGAESCNGNAQRFRHGLPLYPGTAPPD